jgi:uncharacterized iron-regulated membrane protein
MTVRRLVRQVHLWVGLLFSLLLFLLGATGAALVYKEAYWRIVYPELRGPMPVQEPSGQAAAIAAAWAEFGDELRSVKLPEPGVAAYHLYLTDGEAFLGAEDHRVIDRWESSERLMSLLFDLHAHLMAGEGGERVGGIVGLFGVLLAVTGLVLWWPARRLFSPRTLLPRGTSRRALIHWHRDLGLIASPILLVLLLTGSGLVFYNAAGALLNGMFGDPAVAAEAPAEYTGPPVALADAAILARVREEFPAARLVFYYPPRDGAAHNEFRLKQPCELHPNGRSYLHLDAAGRVLRKDDACGIRPGQEALHALYPLHAGKAGSALYQLLTFLGGLALAALAASGVWAYGRQLTIDN